MNATQWSPDTGMFNPSIPEPGQGTRRPGRPDFDLTHPDKWPQWLKACHTENASIEVLPPTEAHPEGYVIWWGGNMHDGIWMDGLFAGGRWSDGIWLGGDFYEGIWCRGEFRGGTFHSWQWLNGVFRAGTFRGTWMGGIWRPYAPGAAKFEGFWKRTTEAPGMRVELEEWEKE